MAVPPKPNLTSRLEAVLPVRVKVSCAISDVLPILAVGSVATTVTVGVDVSVVDGGGVVVVGGGVVVVGGGVGVAVVVPDLLNVNVAVEDVPTM